MMTLCSDRGFAPTARRRRGAALALEAMEERLAPSPTLAIPPPPAAGVVANFPHNPSISTDPCTGGGAVSQFPHNPDFPTDPCADGGAVSQFPHNPG
jgi:hypothetical protein